MKRYVIFGGVPEGDVVPLFWSNEDGWVTLESATTFTMREMELMNLPVGEAWWLEMPKS